MKKAFTLVELIVSIIIIALASVTLPLMLSTANKLEEGYINQDIFFKSAAIMADIFSKAWDDDSNASEIEQNRTLMWTTNNADAAVRSVELNNTGTRYRVGSLRENNYRYFYTSPETNATAIPSASVPLTNGSYRNHINDYNNNHISESTANGNIESNISVVYVSDKVDNNNSKTQNATWSLNGGTTYTAATDSTNLKRISVKTSRNIGSEVMSVEFVYFSSNIGSQGLKTK